jgi:endonuclease/exonuclease/phosphatase family metal-dependent hydrolase
MAVASRCSRIIAFLLVWITLADAARAQAPAFTVLTYNIRAGLGGADADRKPQEARGAAVDLAPIVAAIKSTKADVVALQEVVGDAQARYIASSLGMSYVYARHGAHFGDWWGLAILSKFAIATHTSIPISEGRGNTRSNLSAVIGIGGKDVTVINTHVDKDLKDGASLKRMLAHIATVRGPLILLGDFNARPDTKRLAPVRAQLFDVADIETAKGAEALRRHPTFTRDGHIVPKARIDYIFVDRKFVDVPEVGLMSRTHWPASDHIGVTAVIQIK